MSMIINPRRLSESFTKEDSYYSIVTKVTLETAGKMPRFTVTPRNVATQL